MRKRKKQINAPVGSSTFERRMERQRARRNDGLHHRQNLRIRIPLRMDQVLLITFYISFLSSLFHDLTSDATIQPVRWS